MLNKIILVGRLVQNPEKRKTNSGTSVASFDIAVDNGMNNPDGSRATCFINVTCWNEVAESVAKYTHKGSLVGVDGKLNQRKFTDKNGNNRSIIEVVADMVKFLEPKPQETEKVEEPKSKEVASKKSKR